MNGLFSYDSKIMQALGFLADLVICNLIFLVCCLPIVTIGPATSGLHYAMRTLSDGKDDRSAFKQFFVGFRNGYMKITFAWLLLFIFDLILVFTTYVCMTFPEFGLIPWGIPFAGLCVCLVFHANVSVFHSQFDCSFSQLLRNAFILTLMHPLRSILVGAFAWGPVVIFFTNPSTFFTITPIFLALWWSTGFMLSALLMRKPFRVLIEHYTGEDVIKEEARKKAIAEEEEIEALAKANLAAQKAAQESEK